MLCSLPYVFEHASTRKQSEGCALHLCPALAPVASNVGSILASHVVKSKIHCIMSRRLKESHELSDRYVSFPLSAKRASEPAALFACCILRMEVEVPVAGPSSIPAPPPSAPPPAAGPSGLSAGIAARAQSALNRLNELIDAEEALVHNRAQKRSAAKQNATAAGGETATRSCSACRRHKSKCVPSDVPDKCVRCIELGKACVYPGVRNRGAGKRLSKCV